MKAPPPAVQPPPPAPPQGMPPPREPGLTVALGAPATAYPGIFGQAIQRLSETVAPTNQASTEEPDAPPVVGRIENV